ncbi:hypothetical protein PV08_04754 [Exophiala spinifera]|uniref:AB hydrolase-1 domain-containing protein n=1 Tax=Exophiala spinifera TaxID=91928 RepID=A0A0D2BG39_9EURO|nr:uncharacterized protein PV08_04754 [Exophiala spinifera]KIW17560.1 hypothetical protein PV08_04754 [Exophiala spinifera]
MQIFKVSPTISINYTIHKYGPGSNYSTATTPPEELGIWVILIGGLGDTEVTWEAQITAFINAGYSVLTFDNRGVGGSSRPASTAHDDVQWTAADMASDLRALVKHLDLPRYHVMGISMGGMIAQAYALKYARLPADGSATTRTGDVVEGGGAGAGAGAGAGLDRDEANLVRKDELISLTLTCTYAAPGPFCTRMFSLWRDMATRMSVADASREVLLWCFTPEWFADPTQQDLVRAMDEVTADADRDMGLAAYLAQLNVITKFDSRAVVGRLGRGRGGGGGATAGAAGATTTTEKEAGNPPSSSNANPMSVFVLVGERDCLIPHCQSRELCDLVDGAEWVVTKGAHTCNFESPDEFNENALRCFKIAEERFWS